MEEREQKVRCESDMELALSDLCILFCDLFLSLSLSLSLCVF